MKTFYVNSASLFKIAASMDKNCEMRAKTVWQVNILYFQCIFSILFLILQKDVGDLNHYHNAFQTYKSSDSWQSFQLANVLVFSGKKGKLLQEINHCC